MKTGFDNLVDLAQWRAADAPERQAFTYLADGDAEKQHLTFAQLDTGARAIAAQLQARHLAGERALLLYPPGLEFNVAFLGCLYAGVTAVPTYPPALTGKQSGRSLPRLLSIVGNARPRVALTTAQTLVAVERAFPDEACTGRGMEWIASDTVALQDAAAWKPIPVAADALAFLQYTSGSTSEPKGVMLTHGNILHNQDLIARKLGLEESSRVVSWLPVYHDMGLCNALFAPLYSGFRVVILPPTSFLVRPMRWLRAVSDYEADVSGAPNFAYDLCVQRIKTAEIETLNLSSWRVAFNGAEPVHAATLARFTETFARAGFSAKTFFPCYGLAESTLFVSGGHIDAPPVVRSFDKSALTTGQARLSAGDGAVDLVSSGSEFVDNTLRIVDPQTLNEVSPGSVGEIWVSGPSNGRGYWGLPEESENTFGASIARTGEGPFLRTGDLGFIEDGQLFVTGRAKDIIIMYGANHYPQDIERTVEQSHRALRWNSNAAFATHTREQERLVVVQELDPRAGEVDREEVARSVRKAVAETYQIHVHSLVLIKPGTIYRTSSGKIQRSACKAGYLDSTLQVI